MDFQDAINAHAQWKVRLSMYAGSPDNSLDGLEVGSETKCVLGQWINDEGAKFDYLPEYVTLKADHAQFHRRAAEVVRLVDAGQK